VVKNIIMVQKARLPVQKPNSKEKTPYFLPLFGKSDKNLASAQTSYASWQH
jgi:hypothetical protein